jgi:hypothetical protein
MPVRSKSQLIAKGETMKNINALNGAELSDLFCEFVEKNGHRDSLKAMDLIAQHWFRDAVILEEEDFPEELPRLRYYSELTGVPVVETIREIFEDWFYVTYPVRIERIEKKRGIPSTLEVLPSREMPKLPEAWEPASPRKDLPN